jgi:hypothetical protein
MYIERITVEPDPTNILGMPDSDFGFTTEIELGSDSA